MIHKFNQCVPGGSGKQMQTIRHAVACKSADCRTGAFLYTLLRVNKPRDDVRNDVRIVAGPERNTLREQRDSSLSTIMAATLPPSVVGSQFTAVGVIGGLGSGASSVGRRE